jgi:DNA-binding MarR family transcriptional regulator
MIKEERLNMSDEVTIAEYRALAEVRYHIRRFLRISEQGVRAVDLEPQQYQLLVAVKGMPEGWDVTIRNLADRLQLHHHSTSELVDRLERRGMIQRHRDEVDRRRVFVLLAPRGEEGLEKLAPLSRAELQAAEPALALALHALISARNN